MPVRFLPNAELKKKFLEFSPDGQEIFFTGFRMGVLACLKDDIKTHEELKAIIKQLEKDYYEIVARRANEANAGIRKS